MNDKLKAAVEAVEAYDATRHGDSVDMDHMFLWGEAANACIAFVRTLAAPQAEAGEGLHSASVRLALAMVNAKIPMPQQAAHGTLLGVLCGEQMHPRDVREALALVAKLAGINLAQPAAEGGGEDLWREVERAPCSDGCCGGCCFVRVEHPATPPAPPGGLTEGQREALQRLESRLTNGDFYSDYDNDWALVGKLREVIHRLTAPRAEGVDDNTLDDACKVYSRIAGYDAHADAMRAALTAAAPKVKENGNGR